MVLLDLIVMPIFQDVLDSNERPANRPVSRRSAHVKPPALVSRRLSEESLPTELCEGPVPDSPTRASPPSVEDENVTSCRAELIERLKRGESPTWVPNRHVSVLFQADFTPCHLANCN